MESADLQNLIRAVSCSLEKCLWKSNFMYNFGPFLSLLKTILRCFQLSLSVVMNGKAIGHPSQNLFLLAEHERYLVGVN